MHTQARRALARPIYNPLTYNMAPLTWHHDHHTRAALSVNIGQE